MTRMAGHYLIAASSSAVAQAPAAGVAATDTVIVRARDSHRDQDVDLVLMGSVQGPLERAQLLRDLRAVLRHPHPRVATALDSGVRGLRPFVVLPASTAADGRWDKLSADEVALLLGQLTQGVSVLVEQGLAWMPLSRTHIRVDDQGGAQVIALAADGTGCADEPAALLELSALATSLLDERADEDDPQLGWLRAVAARLAGTAEPTINTLKELADLLAVRQSATPVSAPRPPLPAVDQPAAVEPASARDLAWVDQPTQPYAVVETEHPEAAVPEPGQARATTETPREHPRVRELVVDASSGPVPVVKPDVQLRGGAVDPGFAPQVVRLSTLVEHNQRSQAYVGLDNLLRDYDPELDEPPTMAITTKPARKGWRRLLSKPSA